MKEFRGLNFAIFNATAGKYGFNLTSSISRIALYSLFSCTSFCIFSMFSTALDKNFLHILFTSYKIAALKSYNIVINHYRCIFIIVHCKKKNNNNKINKRMLFLFHNNNFVKKNYKMMQKEWCGCCWFFSCFVLVVVFQCKYLYHLHENVCIKCWS